MPAFAVALFFVLTPLLVAATGSTDPLADLVDAARSGDGRVIAAALLVLTMTALRDFRGGIKWFSGDRGGVLFLFLVSLLGAVSTSLAAGAAIDLHTFVSALQVAVMAAGGYVAVKRLVAPKGVAVGGEIVDVPVDVVPTAATESAAALTSETPPSPPKDAA